MLTRMKLASLALATTCMTGVAIAEATKPAPITPDPTQAATVTVNMETSMGTIVLELNRTKAPVSVNNFVQYANDGAYNGTIFHRVIDGFMVQGGGFKTDFSKAPTRDAINNEAMNGLKNDKYTISMARTNHPHSATNQFFINVKDNDFLNYVPGRSWGYAVFGKVVKGFKVVDAMKGVATGSGGQFATDVPQTAIVIKSVTVAK